MTETYNMDHYWASFNGTNSWTTKTGNITWRMRPSSPLYSLDDNDDVHIEFEALYDHHSSNLWKLHTQLFLILSNPLTSPGSRIDIKKTCYFDKFGQTEYQMSSPIRFDLGKFGSVRTSIAPNNGSFHGLILRMMIRVVKKSTIGIQLPPTDHFHIPNKTSSEVSLWFKAPERIGGYLKNDPRIYDYSLDKFALMFISSAFREMFSNESYKNNDIIISDIYNSKNFEKHSVERSWIDFLRLLYAQKQEFTEDTIEGILYLAVRYNIQFLIADCEEFLISTKQISNSKKLYLAEECDLAKLQLVALEGITIEILENDKLDIFKVFDGMGPKNLKALLLIFCEEEIEEEEEEEEEKEEEEDDLLYKSFTFLSL